MKLLWKSKVLYQKDIKSNFLMIQKMHGKILVKLNIRMLLIRM